MAKQIVTITLYLPEIVFDIQNKTYITGRSRSTGNNFEEVANIQVNGDDENQEQILRTITDALATLRTRLSEYIVETQINLSADNLQLSREDNVVVKLAMPTNYNITTRQQVASGCHRFIVSQSIAEWFTMTDKADAADYAALAAQAITDIREAISKRRRPVRMACLGGSWTEVDEQMSSVKPAIVLIIPEKTNIEITPPVVIGRQGAAVQKTTYSDETVAYSYTPAGAEDDIIAIPADAAVCSAEIDNTAHTVKITGLKIGGTVVSLVSAGNDEATADIKVKVGAISIGGLSDGTKTPTGDITQQDDITQQTI